MRKIIAALIAAVLLIGMPVQVCAAEDELCPCIAVSSLDELVTAAEQAEPGSVIGISKTIQMKSGDAVSTTNGLTLVRSGELTGTKFMFRLSGNASILGFTMISSIERPLMEVLSNGDDGASVNDCTLYYVRDDAACYATVRSSGYIVANDCTFYLVRSGDEPFMVIGGRAEYNNCVIMAEEAELDEEPVVEPTEDPEPDNTPDSWQEQEPTLPPEPSDEPSVEPYPEPTAPQNPSEEPDRNTVEPSEPEHKGEPVVEPPFEPATEPPQHDEPAEETPVKPPESSVETPLPVDGSGDTQDAACPSDGLVDAVEEPSQSEPSYDVDTADSGTRPPAPSHSSSGSSAAFVTTTSVTVTPRSTPGGLVCNDAMLDVLRDVSLPVDAGEWMTRGQAAQFIYDALTEDSQAKIACSAAKFDDITPEHYAINALANAGVIVGYGGSYRPDDTMTWAQFLTILSRFTESDVSGELSHIDAELHWAYESIVTAVARGWIDDSRSFDPDRPITGYDAVRVLNIMKSQNV